MKNNGRTIADIGQEIPAQPEIYKLVASYDHKTGAISLETPDNKIILAGLIRIINDFYDGLQNRSPQQPSGKILVPSVKVPERMI